VTDAAGAAERLQFLADVVTREASYLAQTDGRLFAKAFGLGEVASLPGNPDLAERVDAFVARFGSGGRDGGSRTKDRDQRLSGAALAPDSVVAQQRTNS
jgi:hypothetical protein